MHKLIATIFATLGLNTAAQAESTTQFVDPKTIRYTTLTLSMEELEYVVPTKHSFDGALQFHEDEWRQVEFYPSSYLSNLQKQLTEYKVFEAKNRTQYGWNNVYARKPPELAIVPSGVKIDSLVKLLGARSAPAPILTTTSRPLGQVKNGYTLHLPGGVFLYGQSTSDAPRSLSILVEQGGDDQQVVGAFQKLNKSYGLILIDWRAQQILVSATATGKINVWRP